MDYKKWNIKMKTVADFSVQIKISREIWQKWLKYKEDLKKQKSNKNEQDMEGKADKQKSTFKEYLNEEITEQLKMKNPIDKNTGKDDVEIASISFAYDNQIIMELLQKRG